MNGIKLREIGVRREKKKKKKKKLFKNPNWWDADRNVIYKVWRSYIWDHQTKIHPLVAKRIGKTGFPVYKSSALTTRPRRIQLIEVI